MLAEFDFAEGWELASLLPFAGILLGLVMGAIAQRSRFCLRTAVIGSDARHLSPMAGSYAAALLAALVGVQALVAGGYLDLSETRFAAEAIPVGALVSGGLMFGVGMVLTRGCASRLTVLGGQGNLRALFVLIVFGIVAHAALKGVLAEPRVAMMAATSVEIPAISQTLLGAGIAALALLVIWRSRPSWSLLAAGTAIGALIVGGWFATGVLLFDEFDPRAPDSLAFTGGAAESLFFLIASTAVAPTFLGGMIAGTLLGSFLAATASGELKLESFEDPKQTLRYLLGAVLMGIGGVLGMGCTIGAGLTGISTLAIAPMITLVAIIIGARAAHVMLSTEADGFHGIAAE